MDAGHQSASVFLIMVRLGVHRYDSLAAWHAAEIDRHRVCVFNKEDEVLHIYGDQTVCSRTTDTVVVRRHAQSKPPASPEFPVRTECPLKRIGMVPARAIRTEGAVPVEPRREMAKEAAHSSSHGFP
ncbi:MAG: hypothetical protein GY892_02640, partial [Shimia sp.]|nr:hypothetical protein [Shimia sp.]